MINSMISKYLLPILFLLIILISCVDNLENKRIEKVIETSKLMIIRGDSIMKVNNMVKVYMQIDGEYLKINDSISFPNKIDNIIKISEESQPIVYVEQSISESGDWNNIYIHYFDTQGKLIAFVRNSSFFNGICREGVLSEKTMLIYDNEFNIILEEYELRDESNKLVIDTSDCMFNYRYNYEVYKLYKNVPLKPLN